MVRSRNTRQQILVAAEDLLLTRGFQGFSYHHIAERLGVRNAAIHYYFPSKNDLGLALLRRHREHFRWWAWQLQKQKASPISCLERFVATERRFWRTAPRAPWAW
ncbi:TetR/AcrR family transcriptional regulator [Alkalilimnicola ehrlichii]|uniref:TetR/AcrR family transcriptional regulator n=1 Tax=Alkalilimnicola ehrlichii TaxID=351052 RepID=UPI0015F25B77|nr:TetR/AcrR family transcriptional regulator [Alkalilimnicola ehrlichii]